MIVAEHGKAVALILSLATCTFESNQHLIERVKLEVDSFNNAVRVLTGIPIPILSR
jgi:hypothetical protein